ncbi:hypothetical protein FS749_007253 [Ceratobasidium sp. UAMH 11750]|nr:hypothetical protein FS749_007253 [Ceratobasidium sp. UAMH 11750]
MLLADPELCLLVEHPEMTGWMGPGHHIIEYCIRAKEYTATPLTGPLIYFAVGPHPCPCPLCSSLVARPPSPRPPALTPARFPSPSAPGPRLFARAPVHPVSLALTLPASIPRPGIP